MTTDLDSRLHTAAGSLHRAVENLPLEAPPRPSSRPTVALGVVLLLVAALTTAAVGAVRHDDQGIDVASEPVADVQALVADQVPDGFEVAWAGEQSTAASVDGGPAVGVDGEGAGLVEGQAMGLATYLYGDGAASVGYPFTASDLVVNVWDASELTADAAARATGALDGLTGTVDATVRGHAALVCAPPSCTADANADVTTVWWHETADVEVVLASRSLTVDQVVAIANGLTIDQEDVTLGALPAGLPGPLDEVGRLHDTAVATTRDAVAHWVGYIDPADATGRFVDVTTLAGDSAELMALVWELGADEQISVRGQDGWLALADSGVAEAGGTNVAAGAQAVAGVPQIDLIWQEASGVLVHVTSLGVSQDQVLDLVEGLHAASDDEWLDVKAGVAADAESAAAGAGAAIDAGGTQVDAGAGASAGVGNDTGAGVDAEANAGVSASAGASGAGVDAQVGADVSVGGGAADVEAGLHADLGTEAVIGAVQSTVEQTAAAAAQAQAQLEEGVRSVPGADGLLP
jgi:hypothetical protein